MNDPVDAIAGMLFGHRISVFFQYTKPPYGGSNSFMMSLRKEWSQRGVRTDNNRVGSRTECVLFNSLEFDKEYLRRKKRAGLRRVHRIDGPISVYRGEPTPASDVPVRELNHELATATILQSHFCLTKHLELGNEFINPVIIHNGTDPSVFYPLAARQPARKLRVVASSWSDNPLKGGPVYSWLSEHIDHERFEFTFIGRTQSPMAKARMLPPVGPVELGEELRRHDVYITASQNDPCSNALLEALACGLPTIYLNSGGHPELVGAGGLPFDKKEQIPDLLDEMRRNYESYRLAIRPRPIAEVASEYLKAMGIAPGSAR